MFVTGIQVRSVRDVHGFKVRRTYGNRYAFDFGRRRYVGSKLQHVVLHKRGRFQKLRGIQIINENTPEVSEWRGLCYKKEINNNNKTFSGNYFRSFLAGA